ncbi:hypothetical protein CDAR_451131 [Caerostris darwini]|uniref:Uncharacterized protein n=1 Tax=Caerostris darwini TaxID=1538125 RepID=A0AAV4PP80_9ARAC|nr:hypothetical protein CDAR_451131 [Caerostris darwini]
MVGEDERGLITDHSDLSRCPSTSPNSITLGTKNRMHCLPSLSRGCSGERGAAHTAQPAREHARQRWGGGRKIGERGGSDER